MASLNAPVTVVCPSGVLNAESASRLEKQLVSAVAGTVGSELVVDMSHVESLDNAGLVSFMSAINAAQPLCDRLSICAAPPSVRIVFELTQMDRLFNIIDTAPIALAA